MASPPVYSTSKDFSFFGKKKTILLDNGNGLRSILAICNTLILGDVVVLEGQISEESQVLSFLRNSLLKLCSDQLKDKVEFAIASILEKSLKPCWNSIDSFKDNELIEIMKELAIPLYHGWVVNDQNPEPKCLDEITLSASSDLEKSMINLNCGITDYGLSCLKLAIPNHEVRVLVHNNILYTATKIADELYVLVMDEGLNNGGRFWDKVTNSVMDKQRVREGEKALETQVDDPNAVVENSIYTTSTDFSFLGQMRTILLHNGKGSESVLSFCNALILRDKLVLEGQLSEEAQVLSFLKNSLLKVCSDQLKDKVDDAIASLLAYKPKPAWNGIDSFKNNELFEILQALVIPLFHGWVINDQNAEPKCLDEITLSASSDLERSMANLKFGMTDCGLSCLKEAIPNHEICVLVYNSSLHTATKIDDELCVLITNTGFNGLGKFWEVVSCSSVVGEPLDEERDASYEEGDNNGAEHIGEGAEHIGEGADHIGGGAEHIGEGGEGGEDAFDSDGSLTTHVGGQASPTTVLERRSSSSNDDF